MPRHSSFIGLSYESTVAPNFAVADALSIRAAGRVRVHRRGTGAAALGMGGIVAFVVGSIILMDTGVPGFQISRTVVGGIAAAGAVLVFLTATYFARSRRRPVVTGVKQLLREPAIAMADFEAAGCPRLSRPGVFYALFMAAPQRSPGSRDSAACNACSRFAGRLANHIVGAGMNDDRPAEDICRCRGAQCGLNCPQVHQRDAAAVRGDVAQVADMAVRSGSAMWMAQRIEVSARAARVRRSAVAVLVDVNSMHAVGLQSAHRAGDVYAFAIGREHESTCCCITSRWHESDGYGHARRGIQRWRCRDQLGRLRLGGDSRRLCGITGRQCCGKCCQQGHRRRSTRESCSEHRIDLGAERHAVVLRHHRLRCGSELPTNKSRWSRSARNDSHFARSSFVSTPMSRSPSMTGM